jgi:hypothetical protein
MVERRALGTDTDSSRPGIAFTTLSTEASVAVSSARDTPCLGLEDTVGQPGYIYYPWLVRFELTAVCTTRASRPDAN